MKKNLLFILLSAILFAQTIDVKAQDERVIEDDIPAFDTVRYDCSNYSGSHLVNNTCVEDYYISESYQAHEVAHQESELVQYTYSDTCTELNPSTGEYEDYACEKTGYRTEYYTVYDYECDNPEDELNGQQCTRMVFQTSTFPANEIVTYTCNVEGYEDYELVEDRCIKYASNTNVSGDGDSDDENTTDNEALDVRITDVELVDSSDGTQVVAEPTIDGLKVDFNLSFENVENFAKYTVTIKNNSTKDYKLSNIKPLSSDFIKYEVSFEDGSDIVKPNSEKKLNVIITYVNEAPVSALIGGKFVEDIGLGLNATLVSTNDNLVNPATSDSIMYYINILFVSTALCGVAIISKKVKQQVL